MTAGNSTPLTDGASVVLLSSDAWAKEHGHEPLAYITHQQTAAVDFIGKEGLTEGLLMAPAYAVPKMLKRAGLTLQDFDFMKFMKLLPLRYFLLWQLGKMRLSVKLAWD